MIEFFEILRAINSPAAKVAYAKQHHTPELDQMVADALDPAVTYGISRVPSAVQYSGKDYFDPPGWYDEFHSVLGRLAARELTGNAAKAELVRVLEKMSGIQAETARAILARSLNIGIGWPRWQSEVLGIHNKFEVALAIPLEKARNVSPVNGTYYASRKCDGCRCIAVVDMGTGVVGFRSRQNKEFTSLTNLAPAVLRFCKPLSGVWVLDGELCKVDANGDEDFQAIMKEIRRKDYTLQDCCYQVFDILSYDDFCAGRSSAILSDRLHRLNELDSLYRTQSVSEERCYVKPLKQELLQSLSDFHRWEGYVAAGNWEGFMLRKNVCYRSGRTADLLKVKKFNDAEYVVDSIEFGRITTTLPGQGTTSYEGVTNLVIIHKGNPVGVGAGLTREQRIDWMKSPSHIIGKTITVKYFEETTTQDGKKSLRFPTLKYVYDGGRDA